MLKLQKQEKIHKSVETSEKGLRGGTQCRPSSKQQVSQRSVKSIEVGASNQRVKQLRSSLKQDRKQSAFGCYSERPSQAMKICVINRKQTKTSCGQGTHINRERSVSVGNPIATRRVLSAKTH